MEKKKKSKKKAGIQHIERTISWGEQVDAPGRQRAIE